MQSQNTFNKEAFSKKVEGKNFTVAIVSSNKQMQERLGAYFAPFQPISVLIFERIENFVVFLEDNRYRNLVLILAVETIEQIEAAKIFLKISNIASLVIGPNNYAFALQAGQMGVESYVPSEMLTEETVLEFTLNSETIIKKQRNFSNVCVFTGISGGIGTTTISTNVAMILSQKYPLKNILYIDLSSTKAISNIFFGMPKPEKTIVDLFKNGSFDEKTVLESGIKKYLSNLYFIPGIQKHIDRDAIFSSEHESTLSEFLFFARKRFDVIVIDIGLAEDVNIKTAVQEYSDEIYIVTELKTPHISILKTYIELMNKAGWKDKIRIIVNRSDSANVITPSEAQKIINEDEGDKFSFDTVLPNDSETLRKAWNNGELVAQSYKGSLFYKSACTMVERYFGESQEEKEGVQQKEQGGGFLQRLFKWA